MKKLFYTFLVLAIVTTSCKKETGGGGEGDSLTSISVEVIQDNVIYGLQDFTFRVKGNDYITYTSSSTLYVNDTQITGNTFTPTSAGTFSVYAKKDDLTSPIITVTAIAIDLAVTSEPTTTFIEMEPFEFTAMGSNGTDYTNQATFFVNDVEDDDTVFDPSVAGDYEVYATIGGDAIVSPTITLSATVGYESLTVSLSAPSVFVTETVTFSAEDNLGRYLTNDATYYVDGMAITGNSYTTTAAGDFEVYAIYDAIQSNTEAFDASIATHTTKVLIEQYTGTTCGYCPRVTWKIDQAVQNNSNIIPIAVHGAFSGTSDPYYFPDLNALGAATGVNVGSAPQGWISRTISWDENESSLTAEQSKLVGLGLALNSTRTGSDLEINVQVGFDINYNQELKLVVALLENGLLYNQTNYTSYYGGASTLVDFEHNSVLRSIYTDLLGDVIPSAETTLGNIYSTNLNVTIPSAVEDLDNLTLVVFVTDATTNAVINVQSAAVGFNQDFD